MCACPNAFFDAMRCCDVLRELRASRHRSRVDVSEAFPVILRPLFVGEAMAGATHRPFTERAPSFLACLPACPPGAG